MIIGKQKIKGLQVQIKDTKTKKSRSFTVHGMTFDNLFYRILHFCKLITENRLIRLVCKKEYVSDSEEESTEDNKRG